MAEELNPEIDNQADTSGLSLDNPDKQENSDHEKKRLKKLIPIMVSITMM